MTRAREKYYDAERAYAAKEKIVKAGASRILKDWARGGLTEEAFLEGLRWLCDDPLPEGRLTRELGYELLNPSESAAFPGEEPEEPPRGALVKLRRRYYADGSFEGFWREDTGARWYTGNGNASISCEDHI